MKKGTVLFIVVFLLFLLTACTVETKQEIDGQVIHRQFELNKVNEIFLYKNMDTIFIQNISLIERVVGKLSNIKAESIKVINDFPETNYLLVLKKPGKVGCNIYYSANENNIYIKHIDLFNDLSSGGRQITEVYKIKMDNEFRNILEFGWAEVVNN